jgi:hypothetical protein
LIGKRAEDTKGNERKVLSAYHFYPRRSINILVQTTESSKMPPKVQKEMLASKDAATFRQILVIPLFELTF